tara:strand:+ start:3617 stop:4882 length:1266 start_codon:yes stop_codon:yes gene_type:complete
VDLKDKEYDILVITADDHYEGLDAHGTVQVYKYLKNKLKANCALICTRSRMLHYIEDSYAIRDFGDLPKHKKIFVSDYLDLPFDVAKSLIEENDSKLYYCGMVHNMYTAGCAYPQEMNCDKYQYQEGCYNCKWVTTLNRRNNQPYGTGQGSVLSKWKVIEDFFGNNKYKKNIFYLGVSSFSVNQAKKSFLFKDIKTFLTPLVNTNPCVESTDLLLEYREQQNKMLLNNLEKQNEDFKKIDKICVWSAKDPRNERKGFDLFVDILYQLKNKYMTSKQLEKTLFVCMGDVEGYKQYLPALPQGIKVVLTGLLNEEQLNHVLSASSVYCCTTLEDAGPRTVGEAAANGCPTISYDTCVALDLVNDKSGKILECGDIDGYAKFVHKIIKMKKTAHDKMCLEAFKCYNEYYSDDNTIAKWKEAMEL